MDTSLNSRVRNQIFKFEASLKYKKNDDACFTLEYERGVYLQGELVGLIRDMVPYFALTADEIRNIETSEIYRRAFTRISDADKDKKGDYGELLLFIILEVFYSTPKFVTKARLRSTTTEQIKGFDCAHFSISDTNEVTLWLGEAKFYKNFSSAVDSALNSVSGYLPDADRIKRQLRLLGGEIEVNKGLKKDEYNLLKSYVDGGRSLDKIPINIPILITYDSKCVKDFCGGKANITDQGFIEAMANELNKKFGTIYKKKWPTEKNIKIVFFLFPLESVSRVKDDLEAMERGMKF